MKTSNKNRGSFLITVVILLFIVLSNFLLNSKLVVLKMKRIQYRIDNLEHQFPDWNLEKFFLDELLEIDKKISSGQYQNLLDFVSRKNVNSRLWLENSESISDTGFMVQSIKENSEVIYLLSEDRGINFTELLTSRLKENSKQKDFLILLSKKYTLQNSKNDIHRNFTLSVIVELIYTGANKDSAAPNIKKIKEIIFNEEFEKNEKN